MFVRMSRYLKVLQEAVESGARVALLERERRQLHRDVFKARREVVRLTNVIIRMKQEGYSTHAGDQTWGRYVMDDEEGGAAGQQDLPEGGLEDEEVARAEAEIRAELEQVLRDE